MEDRKDIRPDGRKDEENTHVSVTELKSIPKSFHDYKGIFLLAIALLLVACVLFFLPSVTSTVNNYLSNLAAVLYGIFIAFILNPVIVWFKPRFLRLFLKSDKPCRRAKAELHAERCSLAAAVFICVTVIAVLFSVIVPNVLNSVISLGKELPSLISAAMDKLEELTNDLSWAGKAQDFIGKILEYAQNWITESLVPSATNAVTSITSAAWDVVMFVVNFLIGIVVAVYALKEKKHFVSGAKKLSYAIFKPETSNLLIDTARYGGRVFQGYLVGSLFDCTIVGLITFFFALIAGLPYPLLLAVLIGVTNVIPFFGPFIGAIPSALIILIEPEGGFVRMLVFVIYMVIMNQVEGNIIVPRVLGSTTGISEFWVAFALLFFKAMLGLVGMILGIPLLAVLFYVINKLINKRMEKKNLATDTDFYYNVDCYDTEKKEFVLTTEDELRARNRASKPKLKYFDKSIAFAKKIIKKAIRGIIGLYKKIFKK